jgi:hypothetical protein
VSGDSTVGYLAVIEDPFQNDLRALINKHSKEGGSNTPDFQLARYLKGCLELFDETVRFREAWYGRHVEMLPVPPSNIPPIGVSRAPIDVTDEVTTKCRSVECCSPPQTD